MKVSVISGSPKGEYSITLQTVLYLQSKFPNTEFDIICVGQTLQKLEKDFTDVSKRMEQSDLILFCYPVYTFLAPSQLHRFIELLKASSCDIEGKCAAQITTSKHFYDVTAHRYIEDNVQDLKLHYLGGLSADMDDLLTKKGQNDAVSFWKYIEWRYQNQIFETNRLLYKVDEKKKDFNVAIVTDLDKEDTKLENLITHFQQSFPYETQLINLRDRNIKGGCIGCFNCAVNASCVYKDGYESMLRNEIQTSSAIVYAFTIKDHSMGAIFKMYDDRQFCNGHRTVTEGMPFGYLVNGSMKEESNLKLVLQGRADVGGNFLAGIADSEEKTECLSASLAYALENSLMMPRTFLGVGGMKIFRDMIYVMRGFMKADHKYYRQHKLYDFPQRKFGTIIKMKLIGGLFTNPGIKKKMGNRMNDGMISPYRKLINQQKE